MENASIEAMSLKQRRDQDAGSRRHTSAGICRRTEAAVIWSTCIKACCSEWPSTPSGWSFKVRPCRSWRMWLQTRLRAEASLTFPRRPRGTEPWCTWQAKRAAQTWPVMWLDSSGKMQPLIATPGVYANAAVFAGRAAAGLMMGTSSGTDIYSMSWSGRR